MKFNCDTRQVETFLYTPSNPVPYKLPGTNDEWRDFLDQYMPLQTPKPTPPQQLSQGTLELYKRAIKEPGSLMEEEVLTILEWVPEAFADTRCLEACGCTWQSLITTAVETPQELTYDQVSFILHGRYSTYKDINAVHKRIFGKVNLPAEKRHLLLEAQKAAKDRQYAIAESNARRESSRIEDEKHEVLSNLSGDDKENISRSMRIPWIAQLRASSKPHLGLVYFRIAYDTDEAWVKYKDHIVSSSRAALLSYPRTCAVSRKWKIHFVENDKERLDGAIFENLCKSAVLSLVMLDSSVDLIRYFKNPPASSSSFSALSYGLRSDIFLFVDASAISSLNERPSDHWLEGLNPAPGSPAPIVTDRLIADYVSVFDPSYQPSETYSHHFNGTLEVNPAHISTTFYHRLWPRGQEKGTKGWLYYKQSIEVMYRLANGSGSRKGGIYRPHSSHNYSKARGEDLGIFGGVTWDQPGHKRTRHRCPNVQNNEN